MLILLISTLGLLLRLYNLEKLTTFGGDQGYDFLQILSIIRGDLTLLGPKIGPYNELGNLYLGPIYYYLLLPALKLFNLNPVGPGYFTAFISTLTIPIIYVICLKLYTRTSASIASFLFAINPFIITQSKSASNPHFLPFFSALSLLFLILVNRSPQRAFLYSFSMGASIAVMFALHYLSAALLTLFLAYFLIRRKFKIASNIVNGFLVFSLPQIIFEIKHDFFITKLFIIQIKSGNGFANFVQIPAKIFSTIKIFSKVLAHGEIFPFLLITTVIIYALIKNKQKKIFHINALMFLVIICTTIAILFYSGSVELHYFAGVYPFLFILASYGLSKLIYNSHQVKFITIFALSILVVNSLLNITYDARQGYTMPLGWNVEGQKLAAELISKDMNSNQRYNIASTIDGDIRSMPIRYLLETKGKTPLDVEKYPESQTIFLISRDDEKAISNYTVWEVSSFKPFNITNVAEIQNGIFLYKLTK